MYTISQFAKLVNVTQTTLRNWDKNGKLKPILLESGHRRYNTEHLNKILGVKNLAKLNVLYCRESMKSQKESLIKQEEALKAYCIASGIKIDKIISEFGSGLNYKRPGLLELIDLITSQRIDTLVVFYKDRLLRFGFELFEQLARKYNFKIIVVDDSESNKAKETEFADDIISIIHHFSMKLYGSRNYKKKIENIEKDMNNIKQEI